MLFPVGGDGAVLEKALGELCRAAEKAVDDGYNYMILSDRGVDAAHAAIPAAGHVVHHYLISRRKRSQIAVIVESGEVCETMHVAPADGLRRQRVNPYMAFAILKALTASGECSSTSRPRSAITSRPWTGDAEIMSKMGISTIRSYRGAALFEPLGVGEKLLGRYMGGGISSIGGIGPDDVARQASAMHALGFAPGAADEPLENVGRYAYRRDGEFHGWNPATVLCSRPRRRRAIRRSSPNSPATPSTPILLRLRDAIEIVSPRAPIPLERVEPAEAIMRRFVVEAMSFGAISREVHETLAAAMNRIGGQSNTGEGGEDPARNTPLPDGVAAQCGGSRSHRGVSASMRSIWSMPTRFRSKVAQGAKPGEEVSCRASRSMR